MIKKNIISISQLFQTQIPSIIAKVGSPDQNGGKMQKFQLYKSGYKILFFDAMKTK